MELIIQILMLFIVIGTVLRLSFWRWWQTVLFALGCSVFVVVWCKYAVLQSKTQLADYLSSNTIMQDAAVLITLESVLLLAFCFAALGDVHSRPRRRWLRLLSLYPGVLIFPVLFYLLTQMIYAMPGSDFGNTAYLLAAAVLILIPLLSYAAGRLIPEKELRLEVYFLVSLFVCIIGLITTVNGNVTYAAAEEPTNPNAIILSISLFLIMFLSGVVGNKLRWKISNKKSKIK